MMDFTYEAPYWIKVDDNWIVATLERFDGELPLLFVDLSGRDYFLEAIDEVAPLVHPARGTDPYPYGDFPQRYRSDAGGAA